MDHFLAVTVYVRKEEEKVYNALMLENLAIKDLKEAVSILFVSSIVMENYQILMQIYQVYVCVINMVIHTSYAAQFSSLNYVPINITRKFLMLSVNSLTLNFSMLDCTEIWYAR